jgi:hypothetical protein
MNCPHCNNPIPDQSTVCNACGGDFDPLDTPDAE